MPIGLAAFLSLLLLLASTGDVARVCQAGGSMKNAAQPEAVQLRGRVAKVELVEEDVSKIIFKLGLDLEFVNLSDRPVILLKHPFWLGATNLAGSEEDARAHKYLFLSGGWPSVSLAPQWKDLRQGLNQHSPPPELTRTIASGESFRYETEASLYIQKKGSFDKRSLPWETIRKASPVWLRVTVEVWPVNVEPKVDPDNLEFGKTLQQRWKPFGQLQIGRLTSEPMPLNFPASP